MKQVLCFAGSNSSRSINHQWVDFLASQLTLHQTQLIRLTDFSIEMFSEDVEREKGYPEGVKQLHQLIRKADALMISTNEHNGNPSAFFKNILDWLSRLDIEFLKEKKILLTSTSEGRRGALSSLEITEKLLQRFQGDIVESFNFPSFSKNFSVQKQEIVDVELAKTVRHSLTKFEQQLSE